MTEADFDTLASLFTDPIYGAPAYAKARLKQRIPELNTVELFVWARDSEGDIVAPSSGLKGAIQDYFDNNGSGAIRLITVDTEVKDGNLLYIDVSCNVTPDGSIPQSDVIQNVKNSIESYFTSASNQPGADVRISKIYNLIQTTDGVSHGVVDRITASYFTDETIGISDGVNPQWDYTAYHQIIASTVTITCDTYTITDDGEGNLTGDVDPSYSNVVDYDAGTLSFKFNTPIPPNGSVININYRYPRSYIRSEYDMTFTKNGVNKRFKGKVKYPPVVPNTFAFTDASQTVIDNGDGLIVGDTDVDGINTIDYDTGAFDITLSAAPSSDQIVSASYEQLLSLNTGDIPVDEDQMPVKGFIDVGLES